MALSHIPFVLSLDSPTYYDHNMFPNRIYRRLHERHHDPLDLHTLGLIARLGAHAHTLAARRHAGDASVRTNMDKDGFQVVMDVGLFQPDELSVKVIDDHIVVEGKHEEREDDHGLISRHFLRRYALPKGYDPDKVVSTLSTDGVLTVSAPKPQQQDKSNEREVKIQRTGPSDLFVKTNSVKSDDGDAQQKN